tara:strand:- start:93 stop:239 length:147 start_codon:yes stop_codon:yes gene_type:complete
LKVKLNEHNRLPVKDKDQIKSTIPARIQFVEKLLPLDKPIFFDAATLQ